MLIMTTLIRSYWGFFSLHNCSCLYVASVESCNFLLLWQLHAVFVPFFLVFAIRISPNTTIKALSRNGVKKGFPTYIHYKVFRTYPCSSQHHNVFTCFHQLYDILQCVILFKLLPGGWL